MGFFAELFRVEDWRRTPLKDSVPLGAFFVTSILTIVVLTLAQWPTAPWRTLIALIVGTAAQVLTLWIIQRRQRALLAQETSDSA